MAASPNDPRFPQQWNMTQIHAGGAGSTGWDISTGDPSIVVCVLDQGCDLTHQDLQFSPEGKTYNGSVPVPGGNGSPVASSTHGTNCAGIVAATYNNKLGVAGVAGNCRIMSVAIQDVTNTEVIAAELDAGIRWAADHGARVINISRQFPPVFSQDSKNKIDNAIDHAFNLGKGVVICIAAGNSSGAIQYPATNPKVIAVGASDRSDNRLAVSNVGQNISVVAPGVGIQTTDLGNTYISNFGDTSAATAHVAGLAALILSVNPNLTNVQVREIIERTADKVNTGTYTYINNDVIHPDPHKTWNQQMGYGRINVLNALTLAWKTNHAPLALSPNSVVENAGNGTVVGTVSATPPTDPDVGVSLIYSLTYSLIDSAGGRFKINSGTRDLTVANGSLLDYEAARTHNITVRVTDSGGLTYDKSFTINVTDVNEAPTALTISATAINENVAAGTAVGTFSSTDPDAANTFTYTLVAGAGSTDNGAFTIAGNALQISASPDFEAKSSYAIRVRTTDQGGLSTEQTFTITVNDVSEAPPKIASQGTGTLRGTWLFDLDNGIEGGGPGSDIWWQQMTNVARQMVPRNNARIVNLGRVDFNSITAESLKTLTYGTTPIPGNNDATNQLVPGDVFAVLTNQGNYAKVLVLNYGYNLNIQWVTYA